MDRMCAPCGANLGEATFSTVRAEGRAMTMEQAIAYALAGSTREA